MKQFSIINLVLSFIALMGFWLIMSGFFDLIHIAQGVLCVSIVIAFNYKLKRHMFFEDEMNDLGQLRFGRAAYYALWMLKEIVKAGFNVSMVIIWPSRQPQITVVKFRTDLPSAHAKMILGNSITLTPGTLTVDIQGDFFIVHSLTPASHAGIIDDSMPRQVLKLFQKEERQVVHDIRILKSPDQITST